METEPSYEMFKVAQNIENWVSNIIVIAQMYCRMNYYCMYYWTICYTLPTLAYYTQLDIFLNEIQYYGIKWKVSHAI